MENGLTFAPSQLELFTAAEMADKVALQKERMLHACCLATYVQCSYCGSYDVRTTSLGATQQQIQRLRLWQVDSLISCGWTINEYNAVKCGPCNWKEEERKQLK
jgi:hypothetical protein